jgi:hypothetical protein
MVPSLTTGCICGVVAHATYAVNAPNDDGGGNPCTSNRMSYWCSPAAVTATPNGDGGESRRAVPLAPSIVPAGSSSMQ